MVKIHYLGFLLKLFALLFNIQLLVATMYLKYSFCYKQKQQNYDKIGKISEVRIKKQFN